LSYSCRSREHRGTRPFRHSSLVERRLGALTAVEARKCAHQKYESRSCSDGPCDDIDVPALQQRQRLHEQLVELRGCRSSGYDGSRGLVHSRHCAAIRGAVETMRKSASDRKHGGHARILRFRLPPLSQTFDPLSKSTDGHGLDASPLQWAESRGGVEVSVSIEAEALATETSRISRGVCDVERAARVRLLESSVAIVEDVRGHGVRTRRSPEGFSADFQVCLPSRGFFVWHVAGNDVAGDANQALFVAGGESYRLSQPVATITPS
jgi:hypothetical protein